MKLTRILIILIPTALIGIAALQVVDMLVGVGFGVIGRLSGVGFVFVGLALAALGCSATMDRGKLRGWMISGLAAAAVAQALWTGVLIRSPVSSSTMNLVSMFATPASSWAGLMMLTGVLFQPRVWSDWGRWARATSVVFAAMLAGIIAFSVVMYPHIEQRGNWSEAYDFATAATRWGGVAAILMCCAMALMVMAILAPRLSGVPADRLIPRMPFRMICPRCGLDQELNTSQAACERCGLRVRVKPA